MAAGGVFALAGLYLLIKPPATDGETKIKVFGLEFNASSGGLLVFLAGVVMIASPVFVPERPSDEDYGTIILEDPDGDGDGKRVLRRPKRIAIEGAEKEDNNTPASANVLPLGSVIEGNFESESDVDFYLVEIPDGLKGDIAFNLVYKGRGNVRLHVLDPLNTLVGRDFGNRTLSHVREIDQPFYYVSLIGEGNIAPYQLSVAARPK
jgi:hypothetical protein